MSKKSSILMFAIGAAAGWTAAQKFSEQGQPWTSSAESPASQPWPSTVESQPSWQPAESESVGEPSPKPIGGDPFRGAFQGAMEEIELRSQKDEPDSQVA